MTVQRNADRWDKSNVLFRDGVIVEYNKQSPAPEMKHIDYGLGALSASVLADKKTAGPLGPADIYHPPSLSRQIPSSQGFLRVFQNGSPTGVARAAAFLHGRGG